MVMSNVYSGNNNVDSWKMYGRKRFLYIFIIAVGKVNNTSCRGSDEHTV